MISIQKKFLFIHVPKTGGNSIQNLLYPFSEDQIITPKPHQDGKERFEIKNERYNIKKHSTLNEYRSEIEPHLFSQLFKFSIIRNPWERMISLYFTPGRQITQWDRNEFEHLVENAKPLRDYVTFHPVLPSWYPPLLKKILDQSPKNLTNDLDFLIKFENLEQDFHTVCKTLHIPCRSLPHRNKSKRNPYSTYYDSDLKKMVGQKFMEEIEFGKYIFGK